MSLPIQRGRGGGVLSAQLHPNAMRKPVMNAGNMRNMVQRAAAMRQSGNGGRVMGGLGVGPTGQAQMPLTDAQFSVSGQRGRRAPSINPVHVQSYGQQQPEQQPQQQQQVQPQSSPKTMLLLLYNGQDGQSMQLVQQLINQNSHPHPQLFQSLVTVVDVRRPIDESSQRVINRLQQLAQFQPMLQSGCVLFDYSQKRAFNDYGAICQMITLQKNVAMSAMFDRQSQQEQQQPQQQQQQQQQQVQAGGYNRSAVTGIGNVGQRKSVRSFARRSVLGGVNPEQLEAMASEANQHVHRGSVSTYSGNRGGGGGGVGGVAGAAGSGTLFSSLGNHEAVAGGQEGSLTQINAKAYRR